MSEGVVRTEEYLKEKFEKNDLPSENDFSDLIRTLFFRTTLTGIAGLKEYDSSQLYQSGTGCFFEDVLYQANKTTTGDFESDDWDPITSEITSSDIVTALGFTPVSQSGAYSNPSWINSLAFSKLSGLPEDLAGYGITLTSVDVTTALGYTPVSPGGSYADPSWITSLAFSKLTGLPTSLAGHNITVTSGDVTTALGYVPVNRAGDYMSDNLRFYTNKGIENDSNGNLNIGTTNTLVLNLGTGSINTAINIGTSGTNTITIGNSNSTINLIGTVINENVTNLNVTDKLITLNKGGAASSAGGTGFEIEEGGSITGYIKITGGRDGFLFKAPTNTADSSFTFTSTVARGFTYPDYSGTVPVAVYSSITTGDRLKWNGSNWINAALTSGDITTALGYTPWSVAGNSGSGLLLGTTGSNTWDAIANGQTVVRFNSVSTAPGHLLFSNTATEYLITPSTANTLTIGPVTSGLVRIRSGSSAYINFSGTSIFASDGATTQIMGISSPVNLNTSSTSFTPALSIGRGISGSTAITAAGVRFAGTISNSNGSSVFSLIDLSSITISNTAPSIELIKSTLPSASNYYFINHTGTAQSVFGGNINFAATAGIADVNGALVLLPIAGSSPVDYLTLRNGVTNVTISATGASTDIDIKLTAKGAGVVNATSPICIGAYSSAGWLTLPASSTTKSQINFVNGVAPTTPQNGDVWFDGTNLFMRVAGATKTFTMV